MSDEELAKTLAALAKARAELVGSPEMALAFLVEAGILMPDGELTPPYRQDP
jgi:hypothetical protein